MSGPPTKKLKRSTQKDEPTFLQTKYEVSPTSIAEPAAIVPKAISRDSLSRKEQQGIQQKKVLEHINNQLQKDEVFSKVSSTVIIDKNDSIRRRISLILKMLKQTDAGEGGQTVPAADADNCSSKRGTKEEQLGRDVVLIGSSESIQKLVSITEIIKAKLTSNLGSSGRLLQRNKIESFELAEEENEAVNGLRRKHKTIIIMYIYMALAGKDADLIPKMDTLFKDWNSQ